MKRCPECRRDYYDDPLLYCLDDGVELLYGPASIDEPATAILSEVGVPPLGRSGSEPGAAATALRQDEAQTRPQVLTTDQIANFDLSRDGKPTLFSRGGTTRDVVLISGFRK